MNDVATSDFLLSAAAVVLLIVAAGLARILRGPGDAERMMAAQLLGTGGVTVLLLAGAAIGNAAFVDVALILALLAAFAAIAFVKKGAAGELPTAAVDEQSQRDGAVKP
ncbi:MAG: monovalent cation/H+ antiporter complex subunit F [Burkholderiaceae bacterium]